MPGAGGVLAFNYLYEKAKPDGLTLVFSLWDPLAQALGNQGLRARYDQYEYLGGISDIRVNYVRSDAAPGGIKKPADIMKAKDIAIGAYASTDVAGILAHLSLKTLGVQHQVVTGYRGGADVFLALQRGERTRLRGQTLCVCVRVRHSVADGKKSATRSQAHS